MKAASCTIGAIFLLILLAMPNTTAMLTDSDTIPPKVTVSQSPSHPLTGDKVLIVVSAFDSANLAKISIVFDGVIVKTCVVQGTRSSCVYSAAATSAGVHRYQANVTDTSGNSAISDIKYFTTTSADMKINKAQQTSTMKTTASQQVILPDDFSSGNAVPAGLVDTPVKCTDTDLSTYPTKNFRVRGTVIVFNEKNNLIYTDKCMASTKLLEYYCTTDQSDKVLSVRVNCTYGCTNGKCDSANEVQQISGAAAANPQKIVTGGDGNDVFAGFISVLSDIVRKIY